MNAAVSAACLTPPLREPVRFASPEQLGSSQFRADYGVRYAYVAGAMYKAIASPALVVRMGNAGMLSFLGTGGQALPEIEAGILFIQRWLNDGQPYGINFLHRPGDTAFEFATIDLYLKYGIRNVEAAGFMSITPALVKYWLQGLREGPDGTVVADHRIIAKVSRPEIALAFLAPAPERIVRGLLADRQVTPAQAQLARRVAMCTDLCAEADSGGHTDGAVSIALIPAIVRLRDRARAQHGYSTHVRIGAAGGIGTPEAIAAVLMLGAEFVVTGSVNQCTVEAGTSALVKDMLQQLDIQDTVHVPAGDLFELGAKMQVMKRGVFFPARASSLYDIWRRHARWEDVDEATRTQIEEKYFMRSFEAVYAETRAHYGESSPEIERAGRDPKHKMALVFRGYFVLSTRLALAGDAERKVDFQVQTGPAMGAFNQWVKGTPFERWENRHVDEIGVLLMQGASDLLSRTLPRP